MMNESSACTHVGIVQFLKSVFSTTTRASSLRSHIEAYCDLVVKKNGNSYFYNWYFFTLTAHFNRFLLLSWPHLGVRW